MKKIVCLIFALLLPFRAFAFPAYTGSAFIDVEAQPLIGIVKPGQVFYAPLDGYSRPTGALAYITRKNLASQRDPVSALVPPGFVQANYDFIPSLNLYNRCHLLANRFSGAEIPENLITGTQYLNSAMSKLETRVAEYIGRTGDSVIYQVTPVYVGNNLLCYGVFVRADAVSFDFHISAYCFNVQPGVRIDYRNGFSRLAEVQTFITPSGENLSSEITFYLNLNTKRFHRIWCHSVETIKPENLMPYYGDRQSLVEANFKPCGECNP